MAWERKLRFPKGMRVVVVASATFLGAWPVSAGDVVVTDAVAYESPAGSDVAVYLTIDNTGKEDDHLVAARTGAGGTVAVRLRNGQSASMFGMTVPGGEESEKRYLMLKTVPHSLVPGERLPVTLTFRHAGDVEVDIAVDPGREEPLLEVAD